MSLAAGIVRRVGGQRDNGPVTRASSTPSMRANKRVVSGRMRRTGCRGVAQQLRAHLRKRSQTAGPRRSECFGDGDPPIFDQTHLPDRKMDRHRLAREHRADATRGAREFERAVLTYTKACQRRCRRVSDRRAEGAHAAHPRRCSNAHVRSAALLLVKRRHLAIAGPACRPSTDGGPRKNEGIRYRGSGERGPDIVPRTEFARRNARRRWAREGPLFSGP